MDRLVSAEKMRKLENDIFALGIDSFTVMERRHQGLPMRLKTDFPQKSEFLQFAEPVIMAVTELLPPGC